MSDTSGSSRARMFAQARPLLPWLALEVALLAVWLAWSGWRGLQEDSRRNSASLARDTAASVASSNLGGERARMAERLAHPDVQAALQSGDLEVAARALAVGWPRLELAQVHPADLSARYAALPGGGFGPLSVMEAALVEDAPVVSVVRVGDGARVAVAAPAR